MSPAGASAESPPALLNYQGFLTDAGGNPVDGEWQMTFRIYDSSEGAQAFFEQSESVMPDVGVFSVLLGAEPDNALPVGPFDDGEAWIGVWVAGIDGEIELKPRQRVVSHPYALFSGHATECDQAANALSLDGKASGDFVTLAKLGDLCISPAQLPDLLDDLCIAPEDLEEMLTALGYEPGSFDVVQLEEWLLANGYKPNTLDEDDLLEWLPAHGYTPGPGFSGLYDDLEGKPDLSVYATQADIGGFATQADLAGFATQQDIVGMATQADIAGFATQAELAGYCAAPCYGDANVQQLLAAGGYNACACYSDAAVLALLAAGGYITAAEMQAAIYTDQDVQAVLEAGGYVTMAEVTAMQYTDDKAVAAVEAAGFLKEAEPLSASQLPPDGLDEVSNGVLTTTFLVEFESPDTPIANNPLSGLIESQILVPGIGKIQEISVSVDLTHADVSETQVVLLGPEGAQLVLHDHGGQGQADLKLIYDESSELPSGTLASFVSKEAEGVWKLQVKDLTVGNEGTLNTWGLHFTALSSGVARVNGNLEVTGALTVGGIPVDPGPRSYVVPGASAPPGTQVVEKYYVGTGSGTYCKKRVRPTCDCGCGTWNPPWVSSDPDCSTGDCKTNCEGAKECTPATHPDGWYKSAPAGDFYQYTGDQAGCNCGPFWYRYQKMSSTAIWTRVKEP